MIGLTQGGRQAALGVLALSTALASAPLTSATFTDPNPSCMIPAERIGVVTSRFGISRKAPEFRKTYNHDGLDFRTGGSVPLYASSDGVVTYMGARGSGGNTILIKRPSGEVYGFYHLAGFQPGLKERMPVKAGQQVGISGNTNSGASTVGDFKHHLHVVYGVPSVSAARATGFSATAGVKPFNLGALPTSFSGTPSENGLAYRTDPSPYFCQTFPIDDGRASLKPVLGADTKAQFAILNGKLPATAANPNATYETGQTQAANEQIASAQAQGKDLLDTLSDADGFGSLPSAPIGAYAVMSTQEMMLTEATRRFSDAKWNTEITDVSSRALYMDLLAARGVSNYLQEATYRKRERVEALLATYSSMRMKGQRQATRQAQEQISQTWLQRLIK